MEYFCPKCAVTFETIKNDSVSFLLCRSCEGISLTFSLLKKHIDVNSARSAWTNFRTAKKNHNSCPCCKKKMNQVTESDIAPFSMCPVCRMTFFSASEKYNLPSNFHKNTSKNKLENLTKQERLDYANALAEISESIHAPMGTTPSFIQLLFAALGMTVPQKGFPNLKATKVTQYLLYGMFAVIALSLLYLSPEQWKTYIGFIGGDF